MTDRAMEILRLALLYARDSTLEEMPLPPWVEEGEALLAEQSKSISLALTEPEYHALRAGLFLVRSHAYDGWPSEGVEHDATNGYTVPAATEPEIAALIERIDAARS